MRISLNDIKVPKKRIRKNIGDLTNLMDSMTKYGLLQPIVIDNNYELIAGYRRYMSATKLGWTHIEAKIVQIDSALARLEIELDENDARKNFDFEELSYAQRRKAKLSKPSIWRKILNFLKKVLFGK